LLLLQLKNKRKKRKNNPRRKPPRRKLLLRRKLLPRRKLPRRKNLKLNKRKRKKKPLRRRLKIPLISSHQANSTLMIIRDTSLPIKTILLEILSISSKLLMLKAGQFGSLSTIKLKERVNNS
jgi:hypothetical protein